MKKVVSIIGARPQFIKAAPLSRKLRKYFKEILVHTGQHYDKNMSELFFIELKIPRPDYNLGIGGGTHGEQTGKMIMGIEKILVKEEPDMVLVYGDTNSTVAGSLAAVKLHIPVVHIEAGLRSFNRDMPEEHNRIVTDHLSDILFVPSEIGMKNLKKEGLINKAYNVGDIMFDALLYNIKIAERKSKIIKHLDIKKYCYNVLTVHRPANTDNKINMKNILEAVNDLNEITIFPVHPRTKKLLKKYNITTKLSNIKFIEPLGYLDILKLVKYSKKVLTDSGGLQKESFYLKKPTIVLRNETEWKELVRLGWTKLTGANYDKIFRVGRTDFYGKSDVFPYGDGKTADKIVEILLKENVK